MRLLRILAFALFALCMTGNMALAEKRVALVIGNSVYQHAPKLPNTVNDADAVTILFKDLGFDKVQTSRDVGINELRRAVSDFSEVTQGADIAVVYYAGHGIEIDGNNFLYPWTLVSSATLMLMTTRFLLSAF